MSGVWIARDLNDKLWFYLLKPTKGEEEWLEANMTEDNVTKEQLNSLFPSDLVKEPHPSFFLNIKWEDKEPTFFVSKCEKFVNNKNNTCNP